MWDLKACVVCLSTDVQLFEIGDGELRKLYNTISGLQTKKYENLPNYVCYMCLAYIRRFKLFREKCQKSYLTLRELSKSATVTLSCLKILDRNFLGIEPNISFKSSNANVCVKEIKFHWTKNNKLPSTTDKVPVIHCDTVESYERFDTPIDEDHKDATKSEVKAELDKSLESDCDFESDNLFDYLPDKKKELNVDNTVEGMEIEQEYAKIIPLSINEAKAVLEVQKTFRSGSYLCELCCKSYNNKARLKHHERMHDKHISGLHICEICSFCYKTEFLLKTHMTEKHMFKYLCNKCNEVNYTKFECTQCHSRYQDESNDTTQAKTQQAVQAAVSAKQHFIWAHMSADRFGKKWKEARPKWLDTRGGSRIKGISYKTKNTVKPPKSKDRTTKFNKSIEEYLSYTPVSQEEQYQIVWDRQKSSNYLGAPFRCELCFRGFRAKTTFDKHLWKHDPNISGELKCDMCKIFTKTPRKMYMHMTTCHVFKYRCKICPFLCYNRNQAILHYRWHNNVTYSCPHCDRKFRKCSTCLTHVRLKHPSTVVCQLCGHSFVSEAGLFCHLRITHTKEEVSSCNSIIVTPDSPLYCNDCKIQFVNLDAYNTHLETSSKHSSVNKINLKADKEKLTRCKRVRRGGAGRPGDTHVLNNGIPTSTTCDVCDQVLPNDVQARRHYETEHPGHEYLKRYMCDVCGHITKQYANLVSHMRTHTREKPYQCPHCDRTFSLPSNRDRHIVVHTGEKRYQCQHCSRRFTQSSAVKLHIQTVHMKIPYAPWNKAHRKRKAKQAAARLAETTKPQTFYETEPNPICMPPPQHKIVIDNTQGDYLNAYITYNED